MQDMIQWRYKWIQQPLFWVKFIQVSKERGGRDAGLNPIPTNFFLLAFSVRNEPYEPHHGCLTIENGYGRT
jgi:hypothetical protein